MVVYLTEGILSCFPFKTSQKTKAALSAFIFVHINAYIILVPMVPMSEEQLKEKNMTAGAAKKLCIKLEELR